MNPTTLPQISNRSIPNGRSNHSSSRVSNKPPKVSISISKEIPNSAKKNSLLKAENSEITCKICLDSAFTKQTGPLMRPCKCAGTMGIIHEECLKTWITSKGLTELDEAICELCLHKFTMEFNYKRKFFPRAICAYGTLSFCTIFCLISLAAVLLMLILMMTLNWDSQGLDPNNSNNDNANTNGDLEPHRKAFKIFMVIVVGIILVMVMILLKLIFSRFCFIQELKKWKIKEYEEFKEGDDISIAKDSLADPPAYPYIQPREIKKSASEVFELSRTYIDNGPSLAHSRSANRDLFTKFFFPNFIEGPPIVKTKVIKITNSENGSQNPSSKQEIPIQEKKRKKSIGIRSISSIQKITPLIQSRISLNKLASPHLKSISRDYLSFHDEEEKEIEVNIQVFKSFIQQPSLN